MAMKTLAKRWRCDRMSGRRELPLLQKKDGQRSSPVCSPGFTGQNPLHVSISGCGLRRGIKVVGTPAAPRFHPVAPAWRWVRSAIAEPDMVN